MNEYGRLAELQINERVEPAAPESRVGGASTGGSSSPGGSMTWPTASRASEADARYDPSEAVRAPFPWLVSRV